MIKINRKAKKMIKKYAKLRGEGNPSLQESILLEVYAKSNKPERQFYMNEMEAYFRAIKKGAIKPGQPITEAHRNIKP